ncbi:MAG: hypothetical protein HGA45_31200, partial [Chloroflexales bacterium]|nr:hypothetical protein [Chloroflexales bacterium]
MTSSPTSLRQQIELDSVKRDACLYFETMVKLAKQKTAPILFPSMAPYLSLFIVEAHNYLSRTVPGYTNALNSQIFSIITAARMRVKFFDDSQKDIAGTFNLLEWVSEFHEEWHIKQHKGILAPIQRALQEDMGVFF